MYKYISINDIKMLHTKHFNWIIEKDNLGDKKYVINLRCKKHGHTYRANYYKGVFFVSNPYSEQAPDSFIPGFTIEFKKVYKFIKALIKTYDLKVPPLHDVKKMKVKHKIT